MNWLTFIERNDAEELPQLPGLVPLQIIGKGAMGLVFSAREEASGRIVAVKIPVPDAVGMSRAFLDEAMALSRLRHPGIIGIRDWGRHEGVSFIVMEFLPGSTLRSHLSRRIMTARETVTLVARIAEALHEAHRNGLVHCDLKPDHVLFRNDDSPCLIDFSIARLTEHPYSSTGAGTMHYMSPEQVAGARPDARSDLYSLGIMFYEMLLGYLPQTPLPVPAELGALSPILNSLLTCDPELRATSGLSVYRTLTAIVRDIPAHWKRQGSRTVSSLHHTPPPLHRQTHRPPLMPPGFEAPPPLASSIMHPVLERRRRLPDKIH